MAGTRKGVLLRLDPAVHDALARWAADDLRSTNAQIEYLLRTALTKAGRMPKQARSIPRRGRPPKTPDRNGATDSEDTGEDTVDSPDAP
ncbi:MAG TPA: hypothetical protein VHV74_13360 [Pseudonocardiaceae bacterium]|jgi:hypothetical protein|nr:hypothetical protein [Pseudonocardiaceae bacterium]